jgi:hypothetical protein
LRADPLRATDTHPSPPIQLERPRPVDVRQ